MQRTVCILIAAFLLTLAAGGVVGRMVTEGPPKPPIPGPDGGWLAQQLELSSDQRKAVEDIWDQTHAQLSARLEQRRAIDEKFQQDVQNLLTADQKNRYKELRDDATAQANGMDADMQNVVNSSVDRTKSLLTPEQSAKYNELLNRFPTTNQPSDQGVGHLATPLPPGYLQPLGGS